MIPKIIHYCWFGRNPLPKLALKCIASWKKFCPDYEIREWNEDNFDVTKNQYCQEAYKAKKWAFVSDYVRLYVLNSFGGIYMDSDVEVIRNLDIFLTEDGFSGFESENAAVTGIMGAKRGNCFVNELLHEYDVLHFSKPDGTFEITTNTVRITQAMLGHGLRLNNSKQTVQDFTIYPKDYFCPMNYRTGTYCITENTYTIHHFAASWHDGWERFNDAIPRACVKVFGERCGLGIGRALSLPSRVARKFYTLGGRETMKLIAKKMRIIWSDL